MAIAMNSFDSWLYKKLQSLNTDEGVFGTYIKGILESDESEDEKTEALENLLSSITDNDIGEHVSEILSAWLNSLSTTNIVHTDPPTEDVDVRLARLLESQCIPKITQKNYTDEERRIRETILAQYSQMSSDEKSDEENDGNDVNDMSGVEKNTNIANIIQQQKEQRIKAKLEVQKKKEKDKEDRERQKQLKEEKKEKRKSQKGDR